MLLVFASINIAMFLHIFHYLFSFSSNFHSLNCLIKTTRPTYLLFLLLLNLWWSLTQEHFLSFLWFSFIFCEECWLESTFMLIILILNINLIPWFPLSLILSLIIQFYSPLYWYVLNIPHFSFVFIDLWLKRTFLLDHFLLLLLLLNHMLFLLELPL